MRVLLDTNVIIWMLSEPERLGQRAELLADPRVGLAVSTASAWEIAIKHQLGRLTLPLPPAEWLPSRLALLGATTIAIEPEHAFAAGALPRHHGDPFDRMLVAQAMLLGLPIVTSDAAIARYDVELLSVA